MCVCVCVCVWGGGGSTVCVHAERSGAGGRVWGHLFVSRGLRGDAAYDEGIIII